MSLSRASTLINATASRKRGKLGKIIALKEQSLEELEKKRKLGAKVN